jgi:hypothetical protein
MIKFKRIYGIAQESLMSCDTMTYVAPPLLAGHVMKWNPEDRKLAGRLNFQKHPAGHARRIADNRHQRRRPHRRDYINSHDRPRCHGTKSVDRRSKRSRKNRGISKRERSREQLS